MHDPAASPITPDLLAQLRTWEGRSEVRYDDVTAAQARGLAATLDRDTAPAHGDVLPALWHWAYFLPGARHSDIGSDGHPRLGGFLPPVPLPRRMWAGGRLQWHAPIRVGDALQRSTRIVSVRHKAGRSGDLVFIVLRHEISRAGALLLREEQDLVYRAPAQVTEPAPASAPAPAPAPMPAWSREIIPDPVLLFRYSALTFNGHRIHYDRPYATNVEGYPGLVVHGPLIATLLAELAQRERPHARVTSFTFKAIRPTIDPHPFRVCGQSAADGKSAQLWALDHAGGQTMQAHIQFD